MSTLRQPLYLNKESAPTLPNGWEYFSTEDCVDQLRSGKLFDNKTASEIGVVPILSQGSDGYIGFHDEEPGVHASPESPVVTFANHTCAIRLMKTPFSCIQNIFPKIGKSGLCDTRYFYYASIGRVVLSDYKGHHPIFRKALISLPSMEKQKSIVLVLSAYDDLIEINEKRIKILEEMAQLLYTEWFVKFKFPGHEKVKMVDSSTEYAKIPEEWKVERLSDFIIPQYGYTASATVDEQFPKYLRGTDINKKDWIDWSKVPNCEIDESDFEKYRVKIGDIFMIRMADPGKVAICEVEIKAVFASYLMRINIKENLTPYYLYYILSSDRYQSYIRGASNGATRMSINSHHVGALDVLIPPLTILKKFESTIESYRSLINRLVIANNNFSQIRDLLIPQLVTGKKELK